MNTTQPAATATAKQAVPPSPPPGHPAQNIPYAAKAAQTASTQPSPKVVGYGLPCAKCRTYYAADLKVCPVCKTGERMSPVVRAIRNAASANEQRLADPAALEQERERFLKEFQAKMLASHPAPPQAAAARCA